MKGKLIVVLVLMCAHLGITGGILTNTNQSAQFVRTLSRNAATDIDAVYFNPAGTSALSEGLHIALYNQTIFQEKTVNNSYPLLAQNEFVGKVNVPFFPNLYAIYKMDDLAISFGFGPNAGGGSAEYSAGLPSFEMNIANLPPLISAMGIPTSGYKADLNFSG